MSNEEEFETLPAVYKTIFTSAQRNFSRQKRGYRFSLGESVQYLGWWKASPKCYRLLQSQGMVLPSVKTLRQLLKKIPFNPGPNEYLYTALRKKISKMTSEKEKAVVLVMDETKIMPFIQMDYQSGAVHGVEDCGSLRANDGSVSNSRTSHVADHVLVYAIRSLATGQKTIVQYAFIKSATDGAKLSQLTVDVIRRLRQCGLDVNGIVSDQGPNNQAAIRILRQKTRRDLSLQEKLNDDQDNVILIDDKFLCIMFDVCHLLKCIRNLLMKYDLVARVPLEEGRLTTVVASWTTLQLLYAKEKSREDRWLTSIIPNIRDEHIF